LPRSSGAKSSQAKILIAEDTADLREALTEVLIELDYNVLAASDGYEAITMFQDFDPDLAILDIHMPMMNGADTCKVIRRTSDIPIIMFTAADEVEEVNGAIEKGATDFVLKTSGIEELATRIESHLARSRPHKRSLEPVSHLAITPLLPNVHISTGSRKAIKTFSVVIDPSKISRSHITTVLDRLNQNYIEVETAAQGTLAIERHDPDIVITEYALPDMDAYQMLSGLERGRNAKKLIHIIMSNRLSPEPQRKLKFVGVNDFLVKPLQGGKVEVIVGKCVKKVLRNLNRSARVAI
jgi:DNA-binding response OmpR family regulator